MITTQEHTYSQSAETSREQGLIPRVKLVVIWLCVAAPLVWGIAKTWQEASRLFN